MPSSVLIEFRSLYMEDVKMLRGKIYIIAREHSDRSTWCKRLRTVLLRNIVTIGIVNKAYL